MLHTRPGRRFRGSASIRPYRQHYVVGVSFPPSSGRSNRGTSLILFSELFLMLSGMAEGVNRHLESLALAESNQNW